MLHVVSVGLVAAAIIGVFFGIGFLRLVSPVSETIADFDRKPSRVYGNAPEADRKTVMASQETGMSHPVAGNLFPGSPPRQPVGTDEAVLPQPPKAAQGFSIGEPPVVTASVSGSASSSAVSSASPTPLAGPPSSAAVPVLSSGTKVRPTSYGRSAHTRTASRHSHPHSARSVPTLTPPQSPFTQTLTPPQTSSFDQLLTQLTGQTKPIGQALTPPQAEQPDLFAQPVRNK